MTYLFENLLLYGLPLMGLPILIHLINMMRHQKVQWAAMEFILASQKKNSSWILIKQLLLLLLRILAVAAIVFMVAQPSLQNSLGRMFGANKIRHFILLDDSYSMADQWGNTTAFEEAKKDIKKTLEQLGRKNIPQDVTLLRYSQIARETRGMQPDLNNEKLNKDFSKKLENTLAQLKPSDLVISPVEVLDSINETLTQEPDASVTLYMFTDVRARDWNQAGEIEKQFLKLSEQKITPIIKNCVPDSHPNLGITSFKPHEGVRVAGINLTMELAVTNYGKDPAKNISVTIEENGIARSAAIVFDEIKPLSTVVKTFEVNVARAGQHRFAAKLPADALGPDNTRHTVIDFQPGVKVLVIDGDDQAIKDKTSDAWYVRDALSPSTESAKLSGVIPIIERRSVLRSPEKWSDCHSIFLLNIPRFDDVELKNLEEYVKQGGGIAFFMGDKVDPTFYNNKLAVKTAGSASLFPAPLVEITQLEAKRERIPDVTVEMHGVFFYNVKEMTAKSLPSVQGFYQMIGVQQYMAIDKNWKAADHGARVIARLRNGAPFTIEHRYGKGRVITFLTTAGPHLQNNDPSTMWNNFGKGNPLYPVVMQQTQAYLGIWKQTDPSHPAGSPLKIEMPANPTLLGEVEIVTPLDGIEQTRKQTITPTEKFEIKQEDTSRAGIYQFNFRDNSNNLISQLYPVNVVTQSGETGSSSATTSVTLQSSEGNLTKITSQRLREAMPNAKYEFVDFDGDNARGGDNDKNNISNMIMYLLILVLVGEQILAYSASYHASTRREAVTA